MVPPQVEKVLNHDSGKEKGETILGQISRAISMRICCQDRLQGISLLTDISHVTYRTSR